jgi:hypothetical protein
MKDMPENLTPADLLAQWKFQDNFREIAVELITAGAHLGSLAFARNVLALKILTGNRTLRSDELMQVIESVKMEIRQEAEKGLGNARGA